MNVVALINGMLARLNLVFMRRSTLDQTLSALHTLQALRAADLARSSSDPLEHGMHQITEQLKAVRKELLKRQVAAKWEVVDFCLRQTTPQPQRRRCPLCEHEDREDAFTKYETHCQFGGGHLLRHQCPNCDVISGADKMFQLTGEELSQDYEWHYGIYEEGDSTEQEIRAFHSLQPSREGVYLNYGAGAWSCSVQLLRQDGWNVLAFEPHGSASATADYLISSRAVLSTMQFDGLFSNNVLEHFRHPIDELSFMRSLLKPTARMAHATPCFDYRFEYTRFHLFFFLGRSRALLAQRIGMTIVETEIDGDYMCCVMAHA